MNKGTWVKGKKTVTGRWEHNWAGDYFFTKLDNVSKITGENLVTIIHGDDPNFNGWELVREEEE